MCVLFDLSTIGNWNISFLQRSWTNHRQSTKYKDAISTNTYGRRSSATWVSWVYSFFFSRTTICHPNPLSARSTLAFLRNMTVALAQAKKNQFYIYNIEAYKIVLSISTFIYSTFFRFRFRNSYIEMNIAYKQLHFCFK